jgi:hypothetical protein
MARKLKPFQYNPNNYPTWQEIWECATLCMETQRVCLSAVRYSLNKGGKYSTAHFVRLLLDTAAVCQTTAECCRSGSGFLTFSSSACAELANLCALSCMRFSGDDYLKSVVEVCKRCATTMTHLTQQINEATAGQAEDIAA